MFKKIEIWVLYLFILISLILIFSIGFVSNNLSHKFFKETRLASILKTSYEIPKKIYRQFYLVEGLKYGLIPNIEVGQEIINLRTLDKKELIDLPFKIMYEYDKNLYYDFELLDKNSKIFFRSEKNDVIYEYNFPEEYSNDLFGINFYDSNGSLKFQTDPIFHHKRGMRFSSNLDLLVPIVFNEEEDNQYYEMQNDFNSKYGKFSYREEGFAKIDINQEITKYNLMDILEENQLEHLILAAGIENDPFHINSVIQAEKSYMNTPIQKNDILVSLRHRSLLILYRPNSNKVIWYKSGPWLNQHDASFMKNGDILLFDNNVVSSHNSRTEENKFFRNGEMRNRILKYNFAEDKVTEIGKKCHLDKIFTVTGGDVSFEDNYLAMHFTDIGILRICNTKNLESLNLAIIENEKYILKDSIKVISFSEYLNKM